MKPLHAIALLLVAALPLTAQTSTVVVPCNLDNTLFEDALGALSSGQGTSVFVGLPNVGGKRRALLRFNVASVVPPNARILSARLQINVAASSTAAPLAVTGHRVSSAWGEGASVATGGTGAPAQTGDATWLHTFYSSSFWTTPGGDFDAPPSFTMTTPQTGVAIAPPSLLAVRDVQAWLDAPASNFGWLLRMVDEVTLQTARRIDSRESTGTRPSLSVTYALPGTVAPWGTSCTFGGPAFVLSIQGAPVQSGTLQLNQTGGPAGGIGANFFDLAIDLPGVELTQGCSVYLTASFFPLSMFTLDALGTASTPLQLPAGFHGTLVASQSAALAPTPLGFMLSNAGYFVIQ
jgi:hypothetical protein